VEIASPMQLAFSRPNPSIFFSLLYHRITFPFMMMQVGILIFQSTVYMVIMNSDVRKAEQNSAVALTMHWRIHELKLGPYSSFSLSFPPLLFLFFPCPSLPSLPFPSFSTPFLPYPPFPFPPPFPYPPLSLARGDLGSVVSCSSEIWGGTLAANAFLTILTPEITSDDNSFSNPTYYKLQTISGYV